MDPIGSFEWSGQPAPDASPAARRLAVALAERLNAILPAPWRARAEGGWVSFYEGERWDGSSDVAGILDQVLAPEDEETEPEDWPFPDRVVSVALGILSAAQDAIAEATTEPWPRPAAGPLVSEGARTDGTRVYLWYGTSEADAVLTLQPIELAELGPTLPS
jgi:hypothetical protein